MTRRHQPGGHTKPDHAVRVKSGVPAASKPKRHKSLYAMPDAGAMPPASQAVGTRRLRVAEEIRHVLSNVFARLELRDPVLADACITVTEVRISPDLKHATAFICRLGRSDVAVLLPALRRAAVYLRGQVAQAMKNQRHTPNLHFEADTTLDEAMHVDALLRQPEVARDLHAD